MNETADDLSAPLGQSVERRKRRLQLPITGLQALAILLGLSLAAFAGFAIFNNDPLGGEPTIRVAIREPGPAKSTAAEHEAKAPPVQPAARAEQKIVTIIDGSSGSRQSVVISGNADTNGGSEPASAAPPVEAGIDQRLLEKSPYGMIPVAAEGLKPFSVYAAANQAKAARMPAVAIVIEGLGVGAAKTTDAIMRLPPAVTLAFTPYGSDPSKLAERARAQRHEIFLQIPMEPYDFPDNDPGPQTLLTSLSAEENLDRLYWHLSRMQGYAGIANVMGARFVASDAAMQPIVREAAKRGLGLFDDGSSPGSVAQRMAAGQDMPFAKGDVSIDTVPTPSEIDRALSKLESIARDRGIAIGTASALPVSIERISAWIKTLDSRGIVLVPLTTAMQKSKSS